jgi:hypothetical protein
MNSGNYQSVKTIVALIAILFIPPQIEAAEIEGVNFDDRYTTAGTSLALRGTGLLRVSLRRGFISAGRLLLKAGPFRCAQAIGS